MMPSRGAQLGARLARSSHYPTRLSPRHISSTITRPLPRSTNERWATVRLAAEQRRNLSLWPGKGADALNKEVDTAHQITTNAPLQSSTTQHIAAPITPSANPSPVQSTPVGQVQPATIDAPSSAPTSVVDVNFDDFRPVSIPTEESLGYLKALGLDYGWGPTATIEWVVEHLHMTAGLPWWASIAAAGALFRLSLFPLTVKMSDSQARMNIIKPETDKLQKQAMALVFSGDQQEQLRIRKELKDLKFRAGASSKWLFINAISNGVLAWCGLKLFRHAAELPVPGFLDGGALWFTNLAVADPYFVIPAVMALALHFNFRWQADPSMSLDAYPQGMRKFMLYGLPVLVFGGTAWFSAGTSIWLASSGLVTILTGRLLLNPGFRESMGIMAMPPRTAASNPFLSSFAGKGDGAEGKVIDVKATSTTSSATSSSSSSRPRTSSPQSSIRYEAPTSRNSSTTATAVADSGILSSISARARASAESTPEGKKGLLEKYTSWGADRINGMGESWQGFTKGVGKFMENSRVQAAQLSGQKLEKEESKTRSKEYMKQANEYEKMVQRGKDREKARERERRENAKRTG